MVERRLGRGLDFFLTNAPEESAAPAAASADAASQATPAAPTAAANDGISEIDLKLLVPNPDQPRRDFHEKEIQELAASIRSSGMLQPILARRRGDSYQIIAGERRWRAAKSIGLERVPVVVREFTDDQVAVAGLVENLHREDLNPVEKARAFRKIQDLTKSGSDEVARKVGLDRTTVTNFMRLLELPAEVLAHVSRGTLTMGHARALLGIVGSDAQKKAAEEVIRQKLSVRQVETLVQELKDGAKPLAVDDSGKPKKRTPPREAWVKECEDNLCDQLQAAVSVKYGRKKAKIVIETNGRDEFEKLYSRLLGEQSGE